MTYEAFKSELTRIAGVTVTHEIVGVCNYLVVAVGDLVMDYFLMKDGDDLDNYMSWHYITMLRMLAAFI